MSFETDFCPVLGSMWQILGIGILKNFLFPPGKFLVKLLVNFNKRYAILVKVG